jgi:hypothetical protein
VASAGAVALGVLGAGCGDDEDEDQPGRRRSDDAAPIAFLLTLEQLESELYAQLARSDLLRGEELELARAIGADERAHARALRKQLRELGGRPATPPATGFERVLGRGRGAALRAAAELEATVAGAYLGQVPQIRSRQVLELALAIHSNEGRHSAALNRLLGRPASPEGALASDLDEAEVRRRIDPYLTGAA